MFKTKKLLPVLAFFDACLTIPASVLAIFLTFLLVAPGLSGFRFDDAVAGAVACIAGIGGAGDAVGDEGDAGRDDEGDGVDIRLRIITNSSNGFMIREITISLFDDVVAADSGPGME